MVSIYAAEGDTTVIQSHQETHWDWASNKKDSVTFPNGDDSYRKILMHYVLGCPTGGCSEWDYKTAIELQDATNADLNLELARVITPYAGDKGNGWFHEYIFDVTHFAPLLTGEKIINAYYGGYQDGFTISVYFEFIEGTPARDVVNISEIYNSGHGGFKYGYSNDPIENYLTDTTITTSANTHDANFFLTATGHGFGNDANNGNPDNCAEFCRKYFNFNLNGTNKSKHFVWKEECGSEANINQTGTWVYDRAGWCPGSEAEIYNTELLNDIEPSTDYTLDVNWQNYTYTSGSGFPIHYWITAYFIEYGEPNFNNNAAVEDIQNPNNFDRYAMFNPNCGRPVIKIQNKGANTLTSCKIYYGIEGGIVKEYDWSGSLDFMESEWVTLPVGNYFFRDNGTNTFYAEVANPNGVSDEYAFDSRMESTFNIVDRVDEPIVAVWRTNSRANETSWVLMDNEGNTLSQSGTLAANTTYRDTFDLEQGCYILRFQDSDCDGLSFFANNDGTGALRLWSGGLPIVSEQADRMSSSFGCFIDYAFTVDYTMNVEEVQENTEVGVFPNPLNDKTNLFISDNNWNLAQINVYSIDGKLMKQIQQSNIGMNQINLDLSELSPGVYNISIDIDHKINKSIKIVKQ